MTKKLIILFSIVIIADLCFMACRKPRNCKVAFTSLDGFASINSADFNPTSAKSITGSILFDSLTLSAFIHFKTVSCIKASNNGILFSKAYATSVMPDNLKIEDSIINYDIVTLNNYNTNFVAGSNINSIIKYKIIDHSIYSSKTKLEFSANIDFINEYNRQFTNIFANYRKFYFSHQMKLIQKPLNLGTALHLLITCKFKSGLVLTDTIEPFTIIY